MWLLLGKGMLAMMPLTPIFSSENVADRRWRSAVLWTVHDLRLSMARRRKLSLPNLCRLFESRLRRELPDDEAANEGVELGRAFLVQFYPSYRASHFLANGNGD